MNVTVDTATASRLKERSAEEIIARSKTRSERQWPFLLMLAPVLLFLGVLFAYPLIDVLLRSLSGTDGWTFEHYQRVVDRPVYLRVMWTTFQIALMVTILALLIGYPTAYVLATARPRVAGLLMIFVLIPFFTSILVRTYAWMVILGPAGILNQSLDFMGLGPVALLYNRVGVLIGMVYALTPYMILTLFSVMRGIDRNLLQAAQNLGASDFQAFRRIFLPLSLPGVVGGSLLVFILALGYFITPRLLGGDRDQMIAMIIEYQVDIALNWNFASVLAVILLIITLVGFAIYSRLVGLQSLFESKS